MGTKYPAIYTDDLGCDKAEVYYEENKFYLKVRGCIFSSDGNDFDFTTDKPDEVIQKFYLKDNELIEYVLDIRILLNLKSKITNKIDKFILRIERQKNYYTNSLLYEEEKNVHEVRGYNFRQLIIKMRKELEKDNNLCLDMPVAAGAC